MLLYFSKRSIFKIQFRETIRRPCQIKVKRSRQESGGPDGSVKTKERDAITDNLSFSIALLSLILRKRRPPFGNSSPRRWIIVDNLLHRRSCLFFLSMRLFLTCFAPRLLRLERKHFNLGRSNISIKFPLNFTIHVRWNEYHYHVIIIL